MVTWLFRCLSGCLLVEMTGFSPERFFNMSSAHEIEIWKIQNVGTTFRFFMTVEGFRKIKPIVRKSKVKLKIIKRLGLPFFLYRNKNRKLYALGFMIFFVAIYSLSLFVWDIQFEGNYMYTYDTLLKFCESKHITYGMRSAKIDCDVLEETLRTQFPEITWVSARVSGTRLLVTIKENKVLSEIPITDTSPCDIVAAQDGIITSMIVRQGVPKVSVGDTIEKGQILVSGTLPIIGDNDEILNTHYIHSEADITARTEYTTIKQLPSFYRVDSETGATRTGWYLKAFRYSMTLIWPKPADTMWKLTMEEEQLHLFQNFYLPVYIGKITGKEYVSYERLYTDEEKKTLSEDINENIKKILLEKGVQILENHVKILDNESLCRIAIDIVAREPIGVKQGIEIPSTAESEETKNLDERN